jgi:hypothetical protein
MKKVFTSGFTILYIVFNIGIGLSSHYCMGFLKNVDFGFTHHNCCGMEEEAADNGCCENIQELVKIQDEQIQSGFETLKPQFYLIHDINFFVLEEVAVCQTFDFNFQKRPPPIIENRRVKMHSLVYYA